MKVMNNIEKFKILLEWAWSHVLSWPDLYRSHSYYWIIYLSTVHDLYWRLIHIQLNLLKLVRISLEDSPSLNVLSNIFFTIWRHAKCVKFRLKSNQSIEVLDNHRWQKLLNLKHEYWWQNAIGAMYSFNSLKDSGKESVIAGDLTSKLSMQQIINNLATTNDYHSSYSIAWNCYSLLISYTVAAATLMILAAKC